MPYTFDISGLLVGSEIDTNPGKPDPGDLELRALWDEFASEHTRYGVPRLRAEFLDHLRELVRTPTAIDEIEFCEDCGYPEWIEDTRAARGNSDTRVCDSCADSRWTLCDQCDELYPNDDLYDTLGGSEVCDSCRDNYYSFCEGCDGYYRDEDDDDHHHSEAYDGCCESPQLEFAIRNDGEEPLKNDKRVTIELPAGTITAEGIDRISAYLRMQGVDYYDLSYRMDYSLDNQWQTREGNYAKRLSKLAYETQQLKLPPKIMSQIGVIARENSDQVSLAVEVTRNLNMDPSAFYHEDSCWWGSYGESRCAFKTNGGFGLRSFNADGYVSGRAWVLPMRQKALSGELTPTFNTCDPDAFVVFNGYGALSNYTAPRIMAHMAGWTYRKIEFSCEPMYVNAGGYLISNEEISRKYKDKELYLNVRQHSALFTEERKERETSDVS